MSALAEKRTGWLTPWQPGRLVAAAMLLMTAAIRWGIGPLWAQIADDTDATPEPPAIENRTVASLVKLARGGDREAATELYRRYRGATHAVALSVLPPDAAGDVVQETFARALAKLESLRDPARFGGWLMTIARNAALDVVKHQSRHGELPDLGRRDPPRVEAARVLSIIQSLPEAYRETLLMRLVEGMSGAEIAERTGLKPGSVRVNLHRGMMMLRAKLEDKGEATGEAKRTQGTDR